VRKISPSTGIRFPDRPACSKSLNLLCYFFPHPFSALLLVAVQRRPV